MPSFDIPILAFARDLLCPLSLKSRSLEAFLCLKSAFFVVVLSSSKYSFWGDKKLWFDDYANASSLIKTCFEEPGNWTFRFKDALISTCDTVVWGGTRPSKVWEVFYRSGTLVFPSLITELVLERKGNLVWVSFFFKVETPSREDLSPLPIFSCFGTLIAFWDLFINAWLTLLYLYLYWTSSISLLRYAFCNLEPGKFIETTAWGPV